MIFNEVLSTYLGWCPRFNVTQSKSTNPLTYLSFIGKAVVITFLTVWGLYNISMYYGIPDFLNLLKNGISIPQFWVNFIQNVFMVISGGITLLLVVDYSISKHVNVRHRAELSGLLVSQAVVWFLAPFYEISMYLSGGGIGQVETHIPLQLATFIPEAILFVYLAYRILSDKPALTRKTFIVLFIIFLGYFVMTINPFGHWNTDLVGAVSIALVELVYGGAAIFCFKVYLNLRIRNSYELTFPISLRVLVFLYGLINSGLLGFLLTRDAGYLLWRPGDIIIALYALYTVGLMAVAFLPVIFRVGENPATPERKL
jgi:hypothetical protein